MALSDRGVTRTILLIPCLFAIVFLVFFLSPLQRILPTGMVEDDAFYYLKIAANAAAGHGSTFDGLDRTNGYHPLWLLLLLPIYKVAGSDPTLAFRTACLLGVLLLLLASLLWHRTLRRAFGEPAPAALGTVVLCFLSFFSSSHAMEMPLLMLVTATFLDFFSRRDPLALTASPREEGLAGVLLAVAFLARLDMVFLGLVVVASVLWRGVRGRWPPKRIWGKILRLILPCLVLPAPYLAWNLYRFGHLVPISGTLKSSFPHPGPYPYVLLHLGPHVIFSILVGMLLILGAFLGKAEEDRFTAVLRLLSAMVLCQVLYAFLFEKWGFAHWQMAPAFFLGSYGCGRVLERLLQEGGKWLGRGRIRLAGAVGVGLALVAALSLGVRTRLLSPEADSFYLAEYEAARWARETLPADAIFVAKSDAGLFSYFSRRRVININDGLVNSFAYQEALRDRGLSSYLAGTGAAWLFVSVDPARVMDGTLRLQARGYLYDLETEIIPLPLASAAYRSPMLRVDWGSGKMFLAILPLPRR